MDQAEKADLINRLAAGDADALQILLVHYHATLRGVVTSAIEASLRRHIEPDDVLQQAYTAAFKALATPSQKPSPTDERRSDDPNPQRKQGPTDPNPERERGARNPSRDRQEATRDPDRGRQKLTQDPNCDHHAATDPPSRDWQGATDPPVAEGPPDAPRFDGPAHFYKWLERIALNQLKDTQLALRRQKRDVAREVAEPPNQRASYPDLVSRLTAGDATPSRVVARHEATVAVLTCLARLGDDQREVIRLRILEDVPVPEIARRLGKTEVAVYALTRRGLKALQELLGPITRYLTRV